jgi:hypothetical protein
MKDDMKTFLGIIFGGIVSAPGVVLLKIAQSC